MTLAWYGHLKFKSTALWVAVLGSWLLALPEYALQVPANRIGYGKFSAYQLKVLQECVTLLVFMVFAFFLFKETPRLKHLVSFLLITAAIVVAFRES